MKILKKVEKSYKNSKVKKSYSWKKLKKKKVRKVRVKLS